MNIIKRKLRKLIRYRDTPLLRLIIYNPWLLWILGGMLIILIVVPILPWKIWQTTPDTVNPVVKISILDKAQSWSLRRTAVKAANEGRFEDSVHAWHSSIANDPGNLEYLREYFRYLMKSDLNNSKSRQAVTYGLWYLKVAQTNLTDLELVTDVLDFYGFHETNHQLLTTQKDDELTPSMQGKFLKALFHEGNFTGFRERLTQVDAAYLDNDPELNLYRSAYMAAWGSPDTSLENLRFLRSKFTDMEQAQLAHRLHLQVSLARRDLVAFKQSFDFLVSRGVDDMADHLDYWWMLVRAGKRDEVVPLLKQSKYPIKNALEVIQYAELAASLGEYEQALQFLNTYVEPFGFFEPVWVIYSKILIRQEDWTKLTQVALRARNKSSASNSLKGFSYFLEGRAAIGQQRTSIADQLMIQASSFQYEIPAMAMFVTDSLQSLGYHKEGLSILSHLEGYLREDGSYWESVSELAAALGEPESMLKAAENLYRLYPDNLENMNDYAALILSKRTEPETALSLTQALLDQAQTKFSTHDTSYGIALINHAFALALNQRLEDAVAHLEQVNVGSLQQEVLVGYHLAWFEVGLKKKDYDLARQHGLLVQKEQLLSGDREWFDKTWEFLNANF